MATRLVVKSTGKQEIGVGADDFVSSVQLQISGGGTYSILAKGYMKGTGLTVADAAALYYRPMATGVVTPGSTAITADGIYEIVADGCVVVLDATYTSGSVFIDWTVLRG